MEEDVYATISYPSSSFTIAITTLSNLLKKCITHLPEKITEEDDWEREVVGKRIL